MTFPRTSRVVLRRKVRSGPAPRRTTPGPWMRKASFFPSGTETRYVPAGRTTTTGSPDLRDWATAESIAFWMAVVESLLPAGSAENGEPVASIFFQFSPAGMSAPYSNPAMEKSGRNGLLLKIVSGPGAVHVSGYNAERQGPSARALQAIATAIQSTAQTVRAGGLEV